MFSKDFPNCCTATVLVGFGQTTTADYEIRPRGELTVEMIKESLGRRLNSARMSGGGLVTCITNNEQVNANQALEEVGFLSSDWASKRQHSETKIKLWWFPVNDKQVNG